MCLLKHKVEFRFIAKIMISRESGSDMLRRSNATYANRRHATCATSDYDSGTDYTICIFRFTSEFVFRTFHASIKYFVSIETLTANIYCKPYIKHKCIRCSYCYQTHDMKNNIVT